MLDQVLINIRLNDLVNALAACLLGGFFGYSICKRLRAFVAKNIWGKILVTLRSLITPLIILFFLAIGILISKYLRLPFFISDLTSRIIISWIIIVIIGLLLKHKIATWFVIVVIIPVASLSLIRFGDIKKVFFIF
jgi:hypothetical protein